MGIYVWGTGCGASELLDRGFALDRVAAFVDSFPMGETFLEKPVIFLEQLDIADCELLIITARHADASSQRCRELGIPVEQCLYLKNNTTLLDRNDRRSTAEEILGKMLLERLIPRQRMVTTPAQLTSHVLPEEELSNDYARLATLELLCRRLENVPGVSTGCCVLLELTNRCNLHCPVCFASAGEQKPHDLSLEEIGKQYNLLMERGGPFNIQLSGGEPTIREDLDEIIALGKDKGFTFFQLNTNGIRLANEDGYAEHLAKAGVSVAFLQFDGLDDEIYRALRGADLLETKIKAIDNCKAAGLPVVLVPTVAPGVNDHALGEILRFALSRTPHIRGVHIQPIFYFGRCGLETPEMRLTIPAVLRRIETQMDGIMKSADFGGGGAESPYCSFHASFLRKSDGSIKALSRRRSQCCCVKSSESRDYVCQQWSGKAAGCAGAISAKWTRKGA